MQPTMEDYLMVSAGNTNQSTASAWAFEQCHHIKGSKLLILLVLTQHAFYTADNPEKAPVGQVLQGYSGISAICQGTGLSDMTVRTSLWSLQADHGYLLRSPRYLDGRPIAYRIQIAWTEQHDQMRAAHRDDGLELPEPFRTSPEEFKTQANRRSPGFKLVQGGREDAI